MQAVGVPDQVGIARSFSRVDGNGRIHFAGTRYYAGHGLARDSVTVRIVDEQLRIYYCGSLVRSYERRHPNEKEEVIWSHHRRQKNRSVL